MSCSNSSSRQTVITSRNSEGHGEDSFTVSGNNNASGGISCCGDETTVVANASSFVSSYVVPNLQPQSVQLDYLTVSYIVMGLVGVVGNSFCCAVIIGHRPLRTRLANYYVINQCALDLVVSFLLLTNMMTYAGTRVSSGLLGCLTCYLWKARIMLMGSLTSSVFNIVALTIERYFEIMHPIKHRIYFSRKIVVVTIAASWIMGVIFKFLLSVTNVWVTADGTCIVGVFRTAAAGVAVSVINFLGEYFLDLCIISYCYIRMGRKLISSVAPKVTYGHESVASRARKNILKTLLSVVVCLALTGLFKQILSLINGLGIVSVDWTGAAYKVSVILQFSNCCINPFIYMFQYKEFQKGVVVMFRRCTPVIATTTTAGASQDTLWHI